MGNQKLRFVVNPYGVVMFYTEVDYLRFKTLEYFNDNAVTEEC